MSISTKFRTAVSMRTATEDRNASDIVAEFRRLMTISKRRGTDDTKAAAR